MSREHYDRLRRAANEKERLVIDFAAQTGARASEQSRVRWRDVHFDNRTVRISNHEFGSTFRTVPISSALCAVLADHRQKSEFNSDDDFVFHTGRGTKARRPNLTGKRVLTANRFGEIHASAIEGGPSAPPIPAKPRWHDLRRFAIRSWFEAGLSLTTIAAFAGVSSAGAALLSGFDPDNHDD